jgi:cytochrome c biogenesis factor
VLTGAALLLVVGELGLIWFHFRLSQLANVVSPDGLASGRVSVPLWVEGEKLFVWALVTALLGVCLRRQRDELLQGVMLVVAVLMLGAGLLGKPFSAPLPSFLGQYFGYLQGMYAGGLAAQSAYEGMESSRQFYYNAWYMWVHPPMLFLAYGAFAISFVATLKMIATRRASFETTAYRWARFGYVWLTLGMLLGLPWALMAWQGDSWWWSGKVNMSLMMWLLYTAYLHARLYLRRRGMWKLVAVLGVLSFVILVLTYATTYVVPGAHSYASAPSAQQRVAVLPSSERALTPGSVGGGS